MTGEKRINGGKFGPTYAIGIIEVHVRSPVNMTLKMSELFERNVSEFSI